MKTKISVFYEEHPELDDIGLVPMKMIVRFPRGKIKWDKSAVYLPIKAPFERHFIADFHDEIMSVTIAFEDLIMNLEWPNYFGISLTHVVERMDKMKKRDHFDFDYNDIEQFIIQIDDLEELLCMVVRPFYELESY
ncbi:hypothetical protein [Paenibacillus sp. UNC451MF]|uniref:hypothetical protein n=1 Tax=Paenibacillus sp. UNC451MF TaxID=1449063 RepID=UPI0004915296|nr:hypothetical protein [Paenibacillus sp. UNC451MF]